MFFFFLSFDCGGCYQVRIGRHTQKLPQVSCVDAEMLPMIGAVVRSVCCRYFKSSSCFSLFHGGLIIYANRHFGYALIFQFYFSSCCRDTTIVDEIRRVSWKLTLNICADILFTNEFGGYVSRSKRRSEEKKFSVHSDPDISSQRRRQFVYFRNSFEIEFKALFGRENSFVSIENFLYSDMARVKWKNVAKFNFEIDFSIDTRSKMSK